MPIYTQHCLADDCGFLFEDIRPISQYDVQPPCRDCGGATERILAPATSVSQADAVVVYRAPDGTFRFPGESHSVMSGRYHAEGFERIEIKGAAEMRRFETHMNARERSLMARKLERKLEAREAREAQLRSEIRRGLDQGFQLPEIDRDGRRTGRMVTVKLSERGRDLMRHLVARNDARPKERTSDPNFHNEVYSFDRSNREVGRDERGRRQRD